MDFRKAFAMNLPAKTDDKYVVTHKNVRVSVITQRLFRAEYSENGVFTDMPTQKVWCRNFDAPKFKSKIVGGKIIITTPQCRVAVNCSDGSFSYAERNGKRIRHVKRDNLKGTYRTLDATMGAISLGDGVISKSGTAVFDDSKSLLLEKNGTVSERKNKGKDVYLFAYGKDYHGAVRDFLHLTGEVPLIPRFALGNWWSRYKAYTQQEYIDLIKRFEEEKIPLTVATIDMDWHWVDLKKKFGNISGCDAKDLRSGWTGYSWNTELFPDYRAMLKWLKEQSLKITVNLHPADGVRFFEDMYKEVAQYMGVDPGSKKRIEFDCTDPKYMEAYFELIHHPYEKDGVDFWWIDWQQGKKSKIKGLDPLWALNHYHYTDNSRDGKRGLILSRFAEPGSQRYAVGFSGDTYINWNCLRFQPYSTATASNIGYTWWSHDIGGHMRGKKDDELYVRWVQFGVFSPINRLHSTSNEFMGKEPWKYGYAAYHIAADFLRLRRRLIPYIYTMNYRTHTQGRALIEPMYYSYPETENAYKCRNQYYFGSELIAAPVTDPADKQTGLACVKVWLPWGRYTDLFTRRVYSGGKVIKMFRPLESFPLLAKEGAIIPLDRNETDNGAENPKALELLAFSGNGKFTLYEDDGETMHYKNGAFAETEFEIGSDGGGIRFVIYPTAGDCSVVPQKRDYKVNFFDISSAETITVRVNGKEVQAETDTDKSVCVNVYGISPQDKVEITLSGAERITLDKREEYIETVSRYGISNEYKKAVFTCGTNGGVLPKCPAKFREPLEEIENCL